jgi:hypothetical protein
VAHSNGWVFGHNIGESQRVFKWFTEMGMNLGVTLVNHMGIVVAHYNGWVFGCNIGESDRVFKWPTEMGVNFTARIK